MSRRKSSLRFGYGPIVSVGVTAHDPLAAAVGVGVGVAEVGISAAVGDEEHPATTADAMPPIAPRASRRLSSFAVLLNTFLRLGARVRDASRESRHEGATHVPDALEGRRRLRYAACGRSGPGATRVGPPPVPICGVASSPRGDARGWRAGVKISNVGFVT